MGRTVYRRMDILKQIADAVTGIGEKVFITDRPAAEQKAMKDFVVSGCHKLSKIKEVPTKTLTVR